MSAAFCDRPDRSWLNRYWIAECRRIIAARRTSPMQQHTNAMNALRKATR